MRGRNSPPILFNLVLAFCTALTLFALTRSFFHEREKGAQEIELVEAEETLPRPVLLYEEKGETHSQPESISNAPSFDEGTIKHIVKDRETLSSISKKYYGTEVLWEKIWEANKSSIPNRNKIKAGIALVIPEKESKISAHEAP